MTTKAVVRVEAGVLEDEVEGLLQTHGKVGIKTHYSAYELTLVNSWLYCLKKVSNNGGKVDPGEELVGNGWAFVEHEDHLHLLLFTGNGRLLARTSSVMGFVVSIDDHS